MKELTNEEFQRFADVMYEKHAFWLDAFPSPREGVMAVIQGVIADTHLLLDGTVSLERWEEAMRDDGA